MPYTNTRRLYESEPNTHFFSLSGFFGSIYDPNRYGEIDPETKGIILLDDNDAIDRYRAYVPTLSENVFNRSSAARSRMSLRSNAIVDYVYTHNLKSDEEIASWSFNPLFGTKASILLCNNKAYDDVNTLIQLARTFDPSQYANDVNVNGFTLIRVAQPGVTTRDSFNDTNRSTINVSPTDSNVALHVIVMPLPLMDLVRKLLNLSNYSRIRHQAASNYLSSNQTIRFDVFDFNNIVVVDTASLYRYAYTRISRDNDSVDTIRAISEGIRATAGFFDYRVRCRSENIYHMGYTARAGYINYSRNPLVPLDDTPKTNT